MKSITTFLDECDAMAQAARPFLKLRLPIPDQKCGTHDQSTLTDIDPAALALMHQSDNDGYTRQDLRWRKQI